MSRRRPVLALALATTLLFVGCKTRAELVVNPDGSGSFTTIAEIEDRILESLGEEGDPFAEAEMSAKDSPFPVQTERYETADGQGIRASYEFDSVEELEERLAETDQAQRESGLFKDGSISMTDQGWRFEAVGTDPISDQGVPFDPSELKKLIDASFVVVLPGELGKHNADSTERVGEGSVRYVWQMTPGESDVRLFAQSVLPGSLLERLLPWGLGLLVVLLLIAGAVISRRRRITPGSTLPR